MIIKHLRKIILIMMLAAIPIAGLYLALHKIPDTITFNENESRTFNFNLPLRLDIETTGATVKSVNFKGPVEFTANQAGEYSINVKLFGIFDLKTMTVSVTDRKTIIPCGFPIGIYLRSNGILVVDTTPFISHWQEYVSPYEGKLLPGDYILTANGNELYSKSEFMALVENSNGEALKLTVLRDGRTFEEVVTPVLDITGAYKTGLWIKDDSQGIGTMTYITTDGEFGALGHGVSDPDTGEMPDTSSGFIYHAKILSITKGTSGRPGELSGTINYSDSNRIGTVLKNTAAGIFGSIQKADDLAVQFDLTPVETASGNEIKKGTAYIQSAVSGSLEQYEIQIKEIHPGDRENKNIVFSVTDQRLLDITNGIVQGMSGSPIIQSGRIIGAVTHVFVNDPTNGYGIFIETMLGE